MANPLTSDDLASLRTDFAANPAYRITQNAVTKVGVQDVALDRAVVTEHRSLGVAPARRLEGHEPEEERTVLALRRA